MDVNSSQHTRSFACATLVVFTHAAVPGTAEVQAHIPADIAPSPRRACARPRDSATALQI